VSLIDALVDAQARAAGWPKPEREYRFHPTRRWRLDFAWPRGALIDPFSSGRPIAIEVQGGIWNRGKHGRGSGIVKDYEKLNHAQAMGWRVLQLTPQQVKNGELETWLRKIAA